MKHGQKSSGRARPGLKDASNHAKHRPVIPMDVITDYDQLLARIASHPISFAKIELRLPEPNERCCLNTALAGAPAVLQTYGGYRWGRGAPVARGARPRPPPRSCASAVAVYLRSFTDWALPAEPW